MIILVIALGFAMLAGLFWYMARNTGSDGPLIAAVILTVFAAIAILMFAIAPPICRYEARIEIEAFHATQETLRAARANDSISGYELAALQTKVVEVNQWLGRAQYQARLWMLRLFWPREILDLKPLQ